MALLYREREYVAMYWAKARPTSPPNSPFQPYDLTPEAAYDYAQATGLAPSISDVTGRPRPVDLFGLKAEVANRLATVLRPLGSHKQAWGVAAQLYADLCRWRPAVDAAVQAWTLGARLPGLALAHEAATAATYEATLESPAEVNAEWTDLAVAIRRRAERAGADTDGSWASNARREWDHWLQRAGLRVRSRVEGPAFTRFVTTESAFCESERRRALADFNIGRVPRDLRQVADLALTLGIGDDACRMTFIRQMHRDAKREAFARIRAAEPALHLWLDTQSPPYDTEAAAYFWLAVAAEQMAGG